MRRALLFCAAIAFAIACGDNVTEPIQDRTPTPTLAPSFATTTTGDGLSISTDKDDYQPGDVVHFTGLGWQPGDTLDIVLTDDPLTHEPHTWTVNVEADGTFHDSTYVVDEGDLNVSFTLVATSRATGRSLTVSFTDAAPAVNSFTLNSTTFTFPATPPSAPATNPITVATLSTVTVQVSGSTIASSGPNPNATWKSTAVQFQGGSINFGDIDVCNDDDVVGSSSVTTTNKTFTFAAPETANTYNVRVRAFQGDGCTGQGGTLTLNGVLIVKTTTSTAVISSQNPSAPGQAVTFTATVTAGTPAVAVTTGSVSFKEGTCAAGTTLQAAQAVNASGQVTFTTSSLATGSHTISGCYGETSSFLSSNGSVIQQVNNTATVTEVASSANPSVTGQSVTFTATVKSDGSPIGAHGTVSFRQGGSDCTTGTEVQAASALNGSGQATYTTSFTATGSPFTIRACYGGATGFDAGSGTISQVVNQASTSTAVISSGSPSVYSEAVTFTATVSVTSPGSGTPAGTVTLKDGTCAAGVTLGSPATLSGGQATFSNITTLSVGSHTITACYAGNGDFNDSDGTVSQVVNQALTSAGVVSSDDQSVFSQSVTFTATVTPQSPATATPDGSVTFHDGAACIDPQIGASKTLNSSGVATSDATTSLLVGNHTVTACYAGSTNFKDSNGNVAQVVDQASTTTTVTSSGSPSILHQSVTFTATVGADAPATATPNGSVTFHDGTCSDAQIGSAKTLSGGSATSDPTTSLSAGNHSITACYAGNSNFKSSDGSVAQQVQYIFSGLYAPVDRPTTMNVSKAGQGIPLKWRLTDYDGKPVLDFAPTALGVAVSGLPCNTSATLDTIEEYAGNSGLQNLGDGYYQYNWKTPVGYANTCKAIGLNLGEGTARGPLAYFNFKK